LCLIAEGIALHARGEAATDPLTGQVVSLISLDGILEPDTIWLYECFSYERLHTYLEEGPHPVVEDMRSTLVWGGGTMVVSGLVSGFSYGSLGDPGLSLIPVLSIICCGGSLSFSLIGYI